MIYVMSSDLSVLDNYEVFMSPEYTMDEIIFCFLILFPSLTAKLLAIKISVTEIKLNLFLILET